MTINGLFKKIIFIILLLISPSFCLTFGKNKVIYRNLDWNILLTNNFEIYFYGENEEIIKEVAIYAENAYRKVTNHLKIVPADYVKLIIYKDHVDFEQTNVVSELITEGVGGFTEVFKDRIALPLVPSPKRLEEVITHEFTHRLQFETLYGGFGKSYKLIKGIFVPLWLMEGMAEYEADDYDPSSTEMLLRDAVINDRLKGIDYLSSFNYLDGRDVVLMYKESQSILEFIDKNYGPDKIGLIFKEFEKFSTTLDSALTKIIGINTQELDKKWQYELKVKHWGDVKGKKEAKDYGQPLTYDTKEKLTYNTKPVFNTTSDKIYFLSDRNNYTGIYELNLNNSNIREIIGNKFDSILSNGNALSISKDGKYLSFIGKIAGSYKIYIYDLKEERIVYEYNLGFDAVYSPSFGQENIITFVGVKGGISDIYICKINGQDLLRVTNDRYDDNEPIFSLDGQDIIYVSEREGNRNLFLISDYLNDKREIKPLIQGNNNIVSPSISPEGNIVFTSNFDKIYNLYIFNLNDNKIYKITDVRGGIFNPKYSFDGKKIVCSYYESGCYNIYIIDSPRIETLPVVELNQSVVMKLAKKDYKFSNFPVVPYNFNFSLDLIYFLIGYDTANGFVGGGYTQASDLFGDHRLELYGGIVKDYQSGFQLSYINSANRINFGVSLFTWRNYGLSVDNSEIVGKYYIEDTGLSLPLIYPFDRFHRVELNFTTKISEKAFYEGAGESYKDLINSVGISFVRDKLAYNIDEVCYGSANNLTIERADLFFGGQQRHTNIFTEYQQYFAFDREMTLGLRLFAGASTDTDRGNFGLGGMYSLRGYDFDEYSGNNMFLANIEFRFPLIDNINYVILPLNLLLIKKLKVVLFMDEGAVWDGFDYFPWENFRNSVGVGLRLHTFIGEYYPLILRFDVAKRTDRFSTEVYYLGLGHMF
ncbi:MAG: peptidase MA family metallohydrolase [Candidatus Firestonebacteria bacterium]